MSEPLPRRLHVLCDRRGVWRVQLEGDARALSEHRTASEAEWAAARHAAETGAQEIVLHDAYYRVHPPTHPHG